MSTTIAASAFVLPDLDYRLLAPILIVLGMYVIAQLFMWLQGRVLNDVVMRVEGLLGAVFANRGLDARPDKVKLALDKTSYRAGDTVQVQVTAPQRGQ